MTWNQVPNWARFLATFGVGIALGVWGGALAYADLKHTAKDAHAGMLINRATMKAHDERIDELEKHEAAGEEWRRSVDDQLRRIYDEVRKR